MPYPPQGAAGVTKHAELTDVSTPHVLADLESAVCSETEADGKVSAEATARNAAIAAHAALSNVHHTPPVDITVATVGDILEQNADTEAGGAYGVTWVKKKEIRLPRAGAYRIKFDIKCTVKDETARGKIYRNGVAVGATQSTTSTSYTTKSEDISGWAAGDLCQLYECEVGTGEVWCRNFRIYVAIPIDGKVTLDT